MKTFYPAGQNFLVKFCVFLCVKEKQHNLNMDLFALNTVTK